MALNNNFISFQSIIESVYRRAGYQTIDWAEAMEVVAETIRLIGVLPAYREVTTNGINGNPIPLEVVDYRVALPTEILSVKTVRKIIFAEEEEDGGTNLTIRQFAPMIESTDLFYQSPSGMRTVNVPAGTYNYVSLTQVETLTLTGDSGTATVTNAGGLTKTLTYDTSLTVTAAAFVTANAAAYLVQGITLTSDGADLIFTATESGTHFNLPVITNTSGDLTGNVVESVVQTPVAIYSQNLKSNIESQYEYKINDRYIYTNFEVGFIEIVYTGFVTDEHGFPMIPDDQRYIEAVRWSIIEFLDYKKWRIAEISDKVYEHSVQQRDWYIASARNKADIPSIDKMEAMKEMFLRSITKVREHDSYFKNSNVAEKRYTQNNGPYSSRYYRRSY